MKQEMNKNFALSANRNMEYSRSLEKFGIFHFNFVETNRKFENRIMCACEFHVKKTQFQHKSNIERFLTFSSTLEIIFYDKVHLQ